MTILDIIINKRTLNIIKNVFNNFHFHLSFLLNIGLNYLCYANPVLPDGVLSEF